MVTVNNKREAAKIVNNKNNNFKNITDNISKEPKLNIDDRFQKGIYKISGGILYENKES